MCAQTKTQNIVNQDNIQEKISLMAHALAEKIGQQPLIIIGIREGGDILAARLANQLQQQGTHIKAVCALDITLYRDDFGHHQHWPQLKASEINLSLENEVILLVDDVLFTGRTVRAALEALLDYGRPASVMLAVLVDRGFRQLPIEANIVGFKLDTPRDILCEVQFCEQGFNQDAIVLVPHGS